MIKKLSRVGNGQALFIDKTFLQEAGLDENSYFQITVDPNGGILIHSVEAMDEDKHQESVELVIRENHDLLRRLKSR